MTNTPFISRMIISTVLSLCVFLICVAYNFKTSNWVGFAIGSYGYQLIDHIIAYFRFNKNNKI